MAILRSANKQRLDELDYLATRTGLVCAEAIARLLGVPTKKG